MAKKKAVVSATVAETQPTKPQKDWAAITAKRKATMAANKSGQGLGLSNITAYDLLSAADNITLNPTTEQFCRNCDEFLGKAPASFWMKVALGLHNVLSKSSNPPKKKRRKRRSKEQMESANTDSVKVPAPVMDDTPVGRPVKGAKKRA